jgi:GDPmannose 4,6-dehydratase
MKTAFITGITGQDGSFLAEFLLGKNYKVVGLVSKKHDIGDDNIKAFIKDLILEEGDLLVKSSLKKILVKHNPHEIYNLGGITFIPASWEKPELTFNVNALGVARLLELIKVHTPTAKFFQATSAKIFGDPDKSPQTEETAVDPQSPYAGSKAAAHFLVRNYRDHFNMFCCSGIMYNHESEKRGLEFVTRKIVSSAVKIKLGKQDKLGLGNVETKLDWGYAGDFVEAMWLMLQAKKPDDYIIATGRLYSVKDICQIAFSYLGLNWKKYVVKDEKFYKKETGKEFKGDISKIKKELGWQPKVSFKNMIIKMVKHDLKKIK